MEIELVILYGIVTFTFFSSVGWGLAMICPRIPGKLVWVLLGTGILWWGVGLGKKFYDLTYPTPIVDIGPTLIMNYVLGSFMEIPYLISENWKYLSSEKARSFVLKGLSPRITLGFGGVLLPFSLGLLIGRMLKNSPKDDEKHKAD